VASEEFKDRLLQIMGGASKRSFAEKCGISEGALRSYLKGETTPDLDTLHAIADVGGCTLAWLAAGQGTMKRGDLNSQATAAVAPQNVAELGHGYVTPRSPEVEELASLLETYGNKALMADMKARLMKIKAAVEGE
jgi:transcriptional regulator with XRE-family HTH domain